MGELKHCYRCMEEINEDLNICPSCGYDASTPNNPMYITPGTLLREKYLCGVLLEYNGEGATYIGKDITTGNKVKIREYMPINLCTRIKNRSAISVNYNNLAKYKAFMAEYTELNKSLAKLRNNPNIITVLDMFAENNTTYTVFKYTDSVKLLDYLKENAGELSWDQVSRIFPPLFNAIGILHNAGITHRAISPDTVYINDKEELTLCGFSVSSARTVNAGLEYELFKGYAAPEQYSASSNSRQGTWTDVYGVCALLYRALTGCMPIDSVTRLKHDDLHEPCVLDSRIPSHVSAVIMRGMSLSGRDRIQTITELVTKLFEQPSDDDDTATLDYSAADALRDAQEQQPRPIPQPEYLDGFAKHYKTGETIPNELIDKIVAAKNYNAAYLQVRQLHFGTLDMAWHTLKSIPEISTVEFEHAVLTPWKVLPIAEGSCISTTITHLFSGGYAAGYYSYKWAEVLAADAFSRFEQEGIFNTEVSASFRENILSKGSSEDEARLYRNFRGHDPEPRALLVKLGIVK